MQEKTLYHINKRLKELFLLDYSGHDYFHTERVYRLSMYIASRFQCDLDVIALAALLHDVDDPKLFSTKNNKNARQIMSEIDIVPEMVERVVKIINNISFKGTGDNTPDSIEGKIVQDADRLDAIGAIGIARAFAYGGRHNRKIYDPDELPNLGMNEELYRNSNGTTINHFYEKLLLIKNLMNTDIGRTIAETRTKVMEEYLKEFMNEWDYNL